MRWTCLVQKSKTAVRNGCWISQAYFRLSFVPKTRSRSLFFRSRTMFPKNAAHIVLIGRAMRTSDLSLWCSPNFWNGVSNFSSTLGGTWCGERIFRRKKVILISLKYPQKTIIFCQNSILVFFSDRSKMMFQKWPFKNDVSKFRRSIEWFFRPISTMP